MILNYWRSLSTFRKILFAGIFFRLIAAIFSRGFGWHDDHFLVIEAAQSWVDGKDYNYWLPSPDDPNRVPKEHPFFYPGVHYILFLFLNSIGIVDPQMKMLFVRLLHAIWSLLIIVYGYRITKQLSSDKQANYVAALLSLLWFMPFTSVRNLVEFVCIPPVMIGAFHLVQKNNTAEKILLAGLSLGLAFAIRMQTGFICLGIGLALLIRRESIKNILLLVVSFSVIPLLTHGLIDFVIWKKPFIVLQTYIQYNVDNAGVYGTDNWHMYFDLLLGMLIPPLSLLLIAGYVYSFRKTLLISLPVLIYVAFHTWFPNKQERFIYTIIPYYVIAGTIGMFQIYESNKFRVSAFWLKFSKRFVFIVNTIVLLILTPSYSKRHRVESMSYLYKKDDIKTFFIDDATKETDYLMPPLFYFGRWFSTLGVTQSFPIDSVQKYIVLQPAAERPNYVVFWQAKDLDQRVAKIKEHYPNLKFETKIEPSFIDQMIYFLNPRNDNHAAFIYRID